MTDEDALPPVTDHEVLARFVLYHRWVREDQSMRQDAFIPYMLELSVTRHLGLPEAELWQLGEDVASIRNVMLYGRADVQAGDAIKSSLDIVPTREPKNHANIINWPAEKPQQKIIALKLAADTKYVPKPRYR